MSKGEGTEIADGHHEASRSPHSKFGSMDLKDVEEFIKPIPSKAKALIAMGYKPRKKGNMISLRKDAKTDRGFGIQHDCDLLAALLRYHDLKKMEKAEKEKGTAGLNADPPNPSANPTSPVREDDRMIVKTAMGLEKAKNLGVKLEGKVDATSVMTKTVDAVAFEHNLFLTLGRMVRYELEGDIKLDEDDRKDPERGARKYLALIQTMTKLKEDAKIMIEKEMIIIEAKRLLGELYEKFMTMKSVFEAVTSIMCPDCHQRAYLVIAMKAHETNKEVKH